MATVMATAEIRAYRESTPVTAALPVSANVPVTATGISGFKLHHGGITIIYNCGFVITGVIIYHPAFPFDCPMTSDGPLRRFYHSFSPLLWRLYGLSQATSLSRLRCWPFNGHLRAVNSIFGFPGFSNNSPGGLGRSAGWNFIAFARHYRRCSSASRCP